MTKRFGRIRCICGVDVSNGGFGASAHEHGRAHIEALRALLRNDEADRLQREADGIAQNRRRSLAGRRALQSARSKS